jgi:predicted ArsR family transcriptional regulator
MNITPISEPKRRVIAHLKRVGPTSTHGVAVALDVSDVAARQHLSTLESQGLVGSDTAAITGRGRPSTAWHLTALANDLFPDRHDDLTVELIAGIRTTLGDGALQKVIEARSERQLAGLRKNISEVANLRERVEALARQRTSEGYMAEVSDADDGAVLLIEHHCPICDAAGVCQLFCVSELELFQAALGEDVIVQREQHLLSGDDRCVYRVTPA